MIGVPGVSPIVDMPGLRRARFAEAAPLLVLRGRLEDACS